MKKIFIGQNAAHLKKNLTSKITHLKDCSLGKVEILKFPNQELRTRILDQEIKEAVIIESLYPNSEKYLFEVLLIVDALKRLGTKKITAVLPWLPYSAQDKVFRSGEPLSFQVTAKLLSSSGLSKIITFHPHNKSVLGFFDIPVVLIDELKVASDFITQRYLDSYSKEDITLVAPDFGQAKSLSELSLKMGVNLFKIDKRRDLATGEVTIDTKESSSVIKNKVCIIVDDFISTGSTIIKTADYLRKFNPREICSLVSYIFTNKNRTNEIKKHLDLLVTTNCFPLPKTTKLTTIDIIPYLLKLL
jgi:ribose-phosphate pyrophosphokinase